MGVCGVPMQDEECGQDRKRARVGGAPAEMILIDDDDDEEEVIVISDSEEDDDDDDVVYVRTIHHVV